MDTDSDTQTSPDPAKTAWLGRLKEALDNIQSQGEFAHFEVHKSSPHPGLQVGGHHDIPLPLVPRDAETIKSYCQQAPFGRKDETVLDLSVRKTWQLDHDEFTFANPEWDTFIGQTVQKLADSLGM
jgi:hypothetical protein